MDGDGAEPVEDGQALVTAQVIDGLNNGSVVASDVGPTIPGVTAAKARAYLLALARAVLRGALQVDRFAVGLEAAGVAALTGEALAAGEGVSAVLVELVWVLWVDTEGPEHSKERARLVELCRDLYLQQRLMSKHLLMETMDSDTLAAIGCVPHDEIWRRKEVKENTRANLTQRKFNLMREESEGFAKLFTALNRFGAEALSEHRTEVLAHELEQLVGCFELDPNRVLDFVLGAAVAVTSAGPLLALLPLFSLDARTHVLGFRFQAHTFEGAPPTPPALYRVAAAAVQAEQVGLEALAGHLAPADEALSVAVQKGADALDAVVGRLGQENLNQASDAQEAPALRTGLAAARLELDARPLQALANEPAACNNQRLGLALGLLTVGNWPAAERLLRGLVEAGMQPAAVPEVARALCADVSSRLAARVAVLYPDGPRGRSLLDRRGVASRVPAPPLGEPELSMLRLLGLHVHHDTLLVTRLARVLRHMHAYAVARAPGDAQAAAAHAQVEELMELSVLPALALTPANPALAGEVWALLKVLPYTARWRLYSRLKVGSASRVERGGWARQPRGRQPLLEAAARLAGSETRRVLRRVRVVEDRRERRREVALARFLAKVAASNSLAVFDTILAHVEAYPNQEGPILEALMYMSTMSFDVMMFVIVERLSLKSRAKIKSDGIHIADWLQWLATFMAYACKRFAKLDMHPLCRYLVNQLKAHQSFDLVVLQELLSITTGVPPVLLLNEDQIESLAGYRTLRQLALDYDVPDRDNRRSSQRLAAALLQGDPSDSVALSLLIVMAQQRRRITRSGQSPEELKLIADLYDRCEIVLIQYTEFLADTLSAADYAALLPPLPDLVLGFGVDPEVAFRAYRPLLQEALLKEADSAKAGAGNGAGAAAAAGQAEAEEGELEEGEAMEEGEAAPSAPEPAEQDGVMVPVPAIAAAAAPADRAAEPANGAAAANGAGAGRNLPWGELLTAARRVLPEAAWKSLTPDFYLLFWTLSYNDIHVPLAQYEAKERAVAQELVQKEAQARRMDSDIGQLRAGVGILVVDPNTGMAMEAGRLQDDLRDLTRELVYLRELPRRLVEEKRAQQAHVARVRMALERGKGAWFLQGAPVAELVQHCVLPRLLLSPGDARFTACLLLLVHDLGAPYFSTLLCLDHVLKSMMNVMACCTEREAEHLGTFMLELLRKVETWRSDESAYEEASQRPGFAEDSKQPDSNRVTLPVFKELCWKWERRLGHITTTCLGSTDGFTVRNVLLFLVKVVKVFPRTHGVATGLQRAAALVRDAERQRQNLKMVAAQYFNKLGREMAAPGRMLTVLEYSGVPAGNRGARRIARAGSGQVLSLNTGSTVPSGADAGLSSGAAAAAAAAAPSPAENGPVANRAAASPVEAGQRGSADGGQPAARRRGASDAPAADGGERQDPVEPPARRGVLRADAAPYVPPGGREARARALEERPAKRARSEPEPGEAVERDASAEAPRARAERTPADAPSRNGHAPARATRPPPAPSDGRRSRAGAASALDSAPERPDREAGARSTRERPPAAPEPMRNSGRATPRSRDGTGSRPPSRDGASKAADPKGSEPKGTDLKASDPKGGDLQAARAAREVEAMRIAALAANRGEGGRGAPAGAPAAQETEPAPRGEAAARGAIDKDAARRRLEAQLKKEEAAAAAAAAERPSRAHTAIAWKAKAAEDARGGLAEAPRTRGGPDERRLRDEGSRDGGSLDRTPHREERDMRRSGDRAPAARDPPLLRVLPAAELSHLQKRFTSNMAEGGDGASLDGGTPRSSRGDKAEKRGKEKKEKRKKEKERKKEKRGASEAVGDGDAEDPVSPKSGRSGKHKSHKRKK
ncbi:hypothetical protein WJX81_003560 [Elliptochloris bilobata]|uniref:THO complex subunit 2 n=1 Tax=Elliptochloris bilobata TaxID=381761 RepID=A0AAW1S196_9CHLO